MLVSIIIATYNRSKQLASVLPSYQKQKYVKDILIIDDVSSDDTEKIVQFFIKSDSRIRYFKNKTRLGACGTKNVGLEIATSKYIFFGEDDLELSLNFIETLLGHMRKKNCDIVAGRRIWPQMNETKAQSYRRANLKRNSPVDYGLLLTDFETNIKNDTEVYLLDASMLSKKEVAKSLLWDTDLFIDPVAWRSETDLQLTAAEKGYKMLFCPHVSAYHLPKFGMKISKWNYLKYDWWVFRNNYFFSIKHKLFLKEKLKLKSLLMFNAKFIFDRIKRRYFNIFIYVITTRFMEFVNNQRVTMISNK